MKDERYKDITVRMLFNHSSGLPGSTFYFGYIPDHEMHKLLLETLADEYLKYKPGAMSTYCNDGFTLAEILVEKISHKKYMDFLKDNIFIPLDMENTGVSVGEINDKNIADYYNNETGKKYPHEAITVYAAGGLSSTPTDLCKFGNSFTSKGKKILSDSSIKEILKSQPNEFSNKLRNKQFISEFGWDYSSLAPYVEKGIQVLGKGGNTPYYSANLQIIPYYGFTIALCISGRVEGESLTRPILDSLMKEKKNIDTCVNHPKKPADAQEIPSELLKYQGFYAGENSAIKVEIDPANKNIKFHSLEEGNEKPEVQMTFIYNNGYLFDNENNIQCYFTTVENKSYVALYKIPTYGVDVIMYQKLGNINDPLNLMLDINNKVWLLKNAKPYILSEHVRLKKSIIYKDLPGYINFCGIKKIETPSFASVAATCFRDQTELYLNKINGNYLAKLGNNIFALSETAQKAVKGTNIIKIGPANDNEWLYIEKAAVIDFKIPEKGRVIVLNSDKVLFDSIVDSGEIYAPSESYVFCAGRSGDNFKIFVN